jgi:hypothetical protein
LNSELLNERGPIVDEVVLVLGRLDGMSLPEILARIGVSVSMKTNIERIILILRSTEGACRKIPGILYPDLL